MVAQPFDSSFEDQDLDLPDIRERIRHECAESQRLWPEPIGAPIGSFPVRVDRLELMGFKSEGRPPLTVTPLGTGSLTSAESMAAALAAMAPMAPLEEAH